MVSKTISKKRCEEYLNLLKQMGEHGLFRAVIGVGMKQSAVCQNPEDAILDESDAILKMYRRTGQDSYLIICKVLRKAAHVVYRQLLLQNPDKKLNRKRFLNSVA